MSKEKVSQTDQNTRRRLPNLYSTPHMMWTLAELQELIAPIMKLGSGAMLLAAVTMSREMTTMELERLTSQCLDEERFRRFVK